MIKIISPKKISLIFLTVLFVVLTQADVFAVNNGYRKNGYRANASVASVSFAEFANDAEYVEKLVPSDGGLAQFGLSRSSDVVTMGEGQVIDQCDITGLKGEMVDFTGVELGEKGGASEDVRTREQKAAMLQNTIFLQLLESCKSGISIRIPVGEYYFAIGNYSDGEAYVIKAVDNVDVYGSGIGFYVNVLGDMDEFSSNDPDYVLDNVGHNTTGNNATILKPYTDATYDKEAAPDMFFFNEYRHNANLDFLSNVKYHNFIIDGQDAVGRGYNSSGKGFMINLFENMTWDYVVVKNTDGTGFGVDNPRGDGNVIRNCIAINNGKMANPSDGQEYGGASGFGIGVGYGNDERLTIENSIAYGNAKFGFFFEHQNRFYSPWSEDYPYDAVQGGTDDAFVVNNSVSAANLFNYGGMRAYDVKITDSMSIATCSDSSKYSHSGYNKKTCTDSDVFFSEDSRRVEVSNLDIVRMFPDVEYGQWYYDAIKWAVANGVTYGIDDNKFGIGEQTTRKDALVLLWRTMGYPGDTITRANNNQSYVNSRSQKIMTCFKDVPDEDQYSNGQKMGAAYYAGAVKWAYEHNPRIIEGEVECSSSEAKDGIFSPDKPVTRAEFVTMLWRLAGKPEVGGNVFNDVTEDAYYRVAANWAYKNGITSGVGDSRFAPNNDCTREQVITMLYRFYQRFKTRL